MDAAAASAKRLTRPRPGHADLAGGMKYGARDLRDVLERASARESAARVAAGAVCKLLLRGVRHRGPQRRPRAGRRRGHALDAQSFAALAEGPRGLAAARGRRGSRGEDGRRGRRRQARRARRSAGRFWSGRAACRRVSAASRPGTRSSTAASGRPCSRCPPSRRSSSARRSRPRAAPARSAHDEIETAAGGRPAPANQPRRRPRGGRDQRRGRASRWST